MRSFVKGFSLRKIYDGLKANWSSGGWDGVDLPIWAPEHPLSRYDSFAGSGLLADRERIENNFEGYVLGAYKSSGPVFACITARQFVFSEAEFCFKNKATGDLYGSSALSLLENPWPGGTTSELLARMEQDVSCSGNSWWTFCNDQGDYGRLATKRGTGLRLAHMRPDWVTMVIGSANGDPRALDAKIVGIIYQPLANGQGLGHGAGISPQILLTSDEVAHYSPSPDPIARFRGMSWITPVLRNIEAHKSATVMKGSFFNNAAVPNMAIKFADETSLDDIEEFQKKFQGSHQGKWQAYKTLFLMGGADAVPLTHNFTDMDFASVVGKDESMIASASGVPASWVGFSEGMQGSALNTGNLAANRRRFADGTIRPLWRCMVASLAVLVDVPNGSVLWWKEDGIAFLREDQQDRATIMQADMGSVQQGILSGYDPDAVVAAVDAKDLTLLLKKHTGTVSVQMQPPIDTSQNLGDQKAEADILQVLATTIQLFVDAGFTHESAIKAAQKNDLALLVKDDAVEPWSPNGSALRNPGGADGVIGPPEPAPGMPPGAPPAASPSGQPTNTQAKPPAAPPKPPGGSNGP